MPFVPGCIYRLCLICPARQDAGQSRSSPTPLASHTAVVFTLRKWHQYNGWLQVSGEGEFFSRMVVDAVSRLDPATLDMSMLGIKKVSSLPPW